MTAPTSPGDARPSLDSEVEFAGYDPYIVALTGGSSVNAGKVIASSGSQLTETQATARTETTASRKVKLMTWLREHRA